MIWVWLHMLLNGSLFALCWPIRVTCEDVENPAEQPPFLVRARIPSSLAKDSSFGLFYVHLFLLLCQKQRSPMHGFERR